MDLEEAAKAFRDFAAVVKALRTPETGCPWDLEQDHRTLRPYLVEEAYEVLDAIDLGDDSAFREELGDLLLQVVLHAQVADDRGAFSITEVIRGITEKMVRRHPHVFGSQQVSGSAEVLRNWEQIKAAESQGKGNDPSHSAALARLPGSLPALMRAQRLGEKAARIPFDWASLSEVLNRVRDDFAKLEGEVGSALGPPAEVAAPPAEVVQRLPDEERERLEHELGDVLFSLCQLARWLGLSAEESLRSCNKRFLERFRRLEQQAPRALKELSQEELEAQWQKAKG
jgi:XTP/dITP diphosphohydrolase